MEKVLSAGAIIVRRYGDTYRYLLLRVRDYWDFPKGLVEPGEDPLQAARREVEEEAALTNLNFPWGYDYRETVSYGHNKVARYYLAESPQGEVHLPVSPELGHPEHDEFHWISAARVRTLLHERVLPIFNWAASIVENSAGKL